MIELKNISKTFIGHQYEYQALIDINLSIAPGEIVGVIGPSGAGKSTLLRCANLLTRPSRGHVYFNGIDLMQLNRQQLRAQRHQIGMIFQHFNLMLSKTVWQNITLPLKLMGIGDKEIQQRVKPLLSLTGLESKKNHYPSQLSGGQKQRVAVARALAPQPKVLLCDEMTSALDPATTLSILNLLKTINQSMQLSMLVVTHEMSVIKQIADRVVVMDQGKIIEQNDVMIIFRQPQAQVTKGLVHDALSTVIPSELQARITDTANHSNAPMLLQLAFIGESAKQAIIEQLIKRFNIHVNILQANLEFLRRETIGTMLLTLQGEATEIEQAKQFMTAQQLHYEVIGYVSSDV